MCVSKSRACTRAHAFPQHKISPVPAQEYGDRFFSFMKAIMRGGEGGSKFLAKEKVE